MCSANYSLVVDMWWQRTEKITLVLMAMQDFLPANKVYNENVRF